MSFKAIIEELKSEGYSVENSTSPSGLPTIVITGSYECGHNYQGAAIVYPDDSRTAGSLNHAIKAMRGHAKDMRLKLIG